MRWWVGLRLQVGGAWLTGGRGLTRWGRGLVRRWLGLISLAGGAWFVGVRGLASW